MDKEYFEALQKQARQGDANAKMLVDRILKGLPMQGGKPITLRSPADQ